MRNYSPSAWAAICISIAALVHFALGFAIEFSVDEAHYALYAQRLAWSYFDHPPLVGWIQWPLVALTSSEGLIRLIPELLWVIACSLVYLVTLELHRYIQNRHTTFLTTNLPSSNLSGLMAVLAIIAAPMPHILAIGLLPDSILAPLSLGILWMALRWLRPESFRLGEWLLLGALLGLAGLSKYTAAFTAIALLLVFLSAPKKPWITQWGFWLAALLALILITPVLYWNWTNDWISFKYQIAHGGGGTWLWRGVGLFLLLQIVVFGPMILLGGIVFIKNFVHTNTVSLLALLGFFLIPFAIFASLSGGGGLPHWTTPAWFCMAPFAGIGLAKMWSSQHRLWIRIFFCIQITLCFLGFGYVLSGGIQSATIKSNPIADLYGWKAAGDKAAELARGTNANGIAVQNWTLGSRAAWYAKPLPVFVLDQRQDQFDVWFGKLPKGANLVLINWSGMPFSAPIGPDLAFEACQPLDSLEIRHFGQYLSKFEFSLCTNWQDASLRD
jgi:4-amino-4-deoxy-L-arabinose transferase-like glycosyltransferase